MGWVVPFSWAHSNGRSADPKVMVLGHKKSPKRACFIGVLYILRGFLCQAVQKAYICTITRIKKRQFLHINVPFCTFCFLFIFGLFWCNPLIFNVFRAFFIISFCTLHFNPHNYCCSICRVSIIPIR